MITETDIAEMLDLLTTAYGEKTFPKDDAEKMDKIINLWTVMFEQDDPAEVAYAVKDCIATLKFPPKIADIKYRISQNRLAGQMTEMEAWALIKNAVESAGSLEEAKRNFDSLPKIIQRTIGSPKILRGWQVIGEKEFETVIASNCMRTYRLLAEYEAGYHALPADIQQVESWRISGPQQIALPEGDTPKQAAYEEPEWITRQILLPEIQEQYQEHINNFLEPVTDEDIKRVERAENRKAEWSLK